MTRCGLLIVLGMLVMSAGAATLAGQGAPLPPYQVPATREPHHNVKLDNRLVRILDVTVAPFDGTLYHIHENPYVYVSIGPALLKAQVLGATEITDLNLKDGEVRFSQAVTHRVGNIGPTPFRNITIQIQGRDDAAGAAKTQMFEAHAAGPQTEIAFENDLVRVDRLMIAPSKASYPHSHAKSHLLVAVHDATVKLDAPGYPPTTQSMQAGDFDWHTGAYSHTITNVGATPFDAIEVIWK